MPPFGPGRDPPPKSRFPPNKGRAGGKSGNGGGKRDEAQAPPQRGRGGNAGARGAGVPPPAGGNTLQHLAARVQHGGGMHSSHVSKHAQAAASLLAEDSGDLAAAIGLQAGRVPRRDMLSTLAELMGAPQMAAYQQAGWGAVDAARHERQVQRGWTEEEEPMGAAYVEPAPPPQDFSRRNNARLGGEGVAGIFGGGATAGAGSRGGGSQPKAAGYMSALHDLKAGLSETQAARAAVQREELKRDLEEQMRQKKEAEARRKAALAEQDEIEEAQLKAYWATQDNQAAGGHRAAAPVAQAAAPPRGQQRGQQQQQAQQQQAQQQQGQGAGVRRAAPPEQQQQTAAYSPPPGGSRRGEALLQPGITVFLPPDKEAERRGAQRARQAAQSYSEEGEAVQSRPARAQQMLSTPADMATWQQAMLQQAAASSMLAAQQQQQAQQQAQTQMMQMLAAANPAMAAPVHASSDPQVLSLLRELAAEQQRMREEFADRLEAVSRQNGDARRDRDRARQDLERVQRLLSERQQGGSMGGGGGMYDDGGRDLDVLCVTSHVLPLGMGIPSRLASPVGRGGVGRQQQQQYAHGGAVARQPARYEQRAVERLPPAQPQRGGWGAAPAAAKPAGRAGAAAGRGRLEGTGRQAEAAPRQSTWGRR